MPTSKLDSLISKGKYTSVYVATVFKTEMRVAVKSYTSVDIDGWNRECKMYLHYKIMHDNILVCFGAGLTKIANCLNVGSVVPDKNLFSFKSSKSLNFLLMTEYHINKSLDEWLEKNLITIKKALEFIKGLCEGLSYLHSYKSATDYFKPVIVHRDLKASNILVKSNGCCCISDFGLAIDLSDDFHNERISQVGTIRYMAPEILDGCVCYRRDILPMIDIYALGLIIWEIITRCKDCEGYHETFQRAYAKELGPYPTKEMAHYLVVSSKFRPPLIASWRNNKVTAYYAYLLHIDSRSSSRCYDRMLGTCRGYQNFCQLRSSTT
ncbi:hypothetical protein HZS_7957 [Henneguya salminicola]|nr:hypothetical protein HZS_7957 [Henneguya salminicola]